VDWSWLVRVVLAVGIVGSYSGSTHRPSWTAASRCRSAGKDGRRRRRDRQPDHGQPAMECCGLCLMTHHDGDLGHRLFASQRVVLQDGEE
jgi:hypothetical protein